MFLLPARPRGGGHGGGRQTLLGRGRGRGLGLVRCGGGGRLGGGGGAGGVVSSQHGGAGEGGHRPQPGEGLASAPAHPAPAAGQVTSFYLPCAPLTANCPPQHHAVQQPPDQAEAEAAC